MSQLHTLLHSSHPSSSDPSSVPSPVPSSQIVFHGQNASTESPNTLPPQWMRFPAIIPTPSPAVATLSMSHGITIVPHLSMKQQHQPMVYQQHQRQQQEQVEAIMHSMATQSSAANTSSSHTGNGPMTHASLVHGTPLFNAPLVQNQNALASSATAAAPGTGPRKRSRLPLSIIIPAPLQRLDTVSSINSAGPLSASSCYSQSGDYFQRSRQFRADVQEMISLANQITTLAKHPNIANPNHYSEILWRSQLLASLSKKCMDARRRVVQEDQIGRDSDILAIRSRRPRTHGIHPPRRRFRHTSQLPRQCHSCHATDTPEWRRGPDGARTLCNACGLHYAKLAKKQREAGARDDGAEPVKLAFDPLSELMKKPKEQ